MNANLDAAKKHKYCSRAAASRAPAAARATANDRAAPTRSHASRRACSCARRWQARTARARTDYVRSPARTRSFLLIGKARERERERETANPTMELHASSESRETRLSRAERRSLSDRGTDLSHVPGRTRENQRPRPNTQFVCVASLAIASRLSSSTCMALGPKSPRRDRCRTAGSGVLGEMQRSEHTRPYVYVYIYIYMYIYMYISPAHLQRARCTP